MNEWSYDQINRLKELLPHYCYRTIARELHKTKNSVAGKVNRLGLGWMRMKKPSTSNVEQRPAPVEQPVKPPLLKTITLPPLHGKSAPPRLHIELNKPPDTSKPRIKRIKLIEHEGIKCSIIDLPRFSCKWPMANGNWCGRKTDGVYCETHRKLAHDPNLSTQYRQWLKRQK